jgi:tetratricopeptide (TPR) repeat protein
VGTTPSPDGGFSFKSAREKNERALAEFQKVLNRGESSPTGKISKYYQGLCLKELNRETEAIAALEPLAKEKSDYGALALQVLAGMYEKNGNINKAVEALQSIISYDQPAAPKSASLMHLGQLLEQLNKNNEAVKAYQQLIKDFPESSLVPKAEERLKVISR